MNVLHITPSFYPAVHWGGPVIANYYLCNALHEIDEVKLKVLTTNSATPAYGKNLTFSNIKRFIIPYKIIYCNRIAGQCISYELLYRLKNQIRWSDLIHLTAVYSFPTIPTLFLARMFDKPVVWSPHGALMRWQGTTKPFLKQYWETICRKISDLKNCCIHVTSLIEEEASKKILPAFSYKCITNGVDIPKTNPSRQHSQSNLLRIIFIGRIHPIKGIENLLAGLVLLHDIKYELIIYGSGEASYLDYLKSVSVRSGIQNNIKFAGHLDWDKKENALLNSDVCIVPSHSENFGMVVAEALAFGLPVICSKGAPWSDLEKHKCGIWTANDPCSLANAIRTIFTMDMIAMGQRGRRWMVRDFNWTSIAKSMFKLYSEMITKKSK